MTNEYINYQQQKKYYDKKWIGWTNQKLSWDDLCRLKFVSSSIEKMKSKFKHTFKIIDLGCGRGWITDALSGYGEVVGADLSIETAQKLYPGSRFIQANIVTDKIVERYDIVVSSEVIEHLSLEDQVIYVRKAHDLLNEPGYLILTTPNKPQAENQFRRFPHTVKQPIENWLDKQSLTILLAPYFEITYAGSTVFHPVVIGKCGRLNSLYSLVFNYLKLYKILNKLLSSSVRGLYLTIVARKRIASG
ncbi:class I SAM-dependent methyltransferase [Chloroflexota bacterium]